MSKESMKPRNVRPGMAFWLLACLVSASPTAFASEPEAAIREASFGGVKVRLPIPKGYCEMPRTSEAGQAYYRLQEAANKGSNVVALLFADCSEWPKREKDDSYRLRRFGSYLFTLSGAGEALAPAEWTRSMLAKEVSGLDATKLVDEEEISRKVQQASEGSASMDNLNLGALAHNEEAAFFSLIANVQYQEEKAKVCGVSALTLINRVPVSMHLYNDYEDPKTITDLLALQRANISALVAANPD